MRATTIAAIALIGATTSAGAQSLADRMARVDGNAQVLFASQPDVCGDGTNMIGDILGRHTRTINGDGQNYSIGRGSWESRACDRGPVRVVATVVGGEVTRLRTFVGRVPPPRADVVSLGTVSAADAGAWLSSLVARGSARVASDAMLPLVVAEGSAPWPQLLRVARDDNRPRDVRRTALFWLGEGVTQHLGIADDARDRSDEDEMRSQAVFAVSQQPREWSVPKLIEVARTSKNAVVRSQAIFWLGQTGDARVADLFAELLGLR